MDTKEPEAERTFFFIPHTHWEGAVFKTREKYLDMGLPNILRALRLLQEYPSYRFTLDQACYVKPFLERYPEHGGLFRRLVDEGRLAIVGGTDVMLDVNMPGGESFVRQVLYGKAFCRRALGVDVTTGWQLDTFGHHAQMPQLLKLAGYSSFWFFRGVPDWETRSEFLWEGIDGSRIPAFWLPHGYAVTYGSPATLPEFCDFIEKRYEGLSPFAGGPEQVGPAGADVCEPEGHVPAMVDEFNDRADAPFRLRIAVPADYEAAVAARSDLPVLRGELNPIFQGTYSSRIELKQATRQIEQLLVTAEKLGAILSCLRVPTKDELWDAWEPMLFNQAHDLMSGVMTDGVYEDTIRGYDRSCRLAKDAVDSRLRSYVTQIDTRGDGVPLVVWNPLSWSRTDYVMASIGFADDAAVGLEVVDTDGRTVPCQIVRADRYPNGAILQAQISFIATEVPALGHVTYRVRPAATSAIDLADEPAEATGLENDRFRLEFDRNGALVTLIAGADGWNALSGPANVLAQEDDHGDLWELYRPLDGGSRIAMKEPHSVPSAGTAHLSTDGEVSISVTRGPVFQQHISTGRLGTGTFSTAVRLYTGLPRIEITTRITNEDEFVRCRALFPTTIRNGIRYDEIPFGAIERPNGIEFPAQNWIDYGDGEHGVSLLNRGLPGNNAADGTILLSLLRSTRIVAYGFGGGYEPGMSSDSGLALGRQIEVSYALLPHTGDWRDTPVYREGWAFNNPLIATTSAVHEGKLPVRWGFVKVDHAGVVVSALRTADDGSTILRMYEAAGRPAETVTIELAREIEEAQEVGLMEEDGRSIHSSGGIVRIRLRPFEIKTLKLRLRP